MAYKIVWTEGALNDMHKVLKYLMENWSYKIARGFEEIILSRLDTLAEEPLIGIGSAINETVRHLDNKAQ